MTKQIEREIAFLLASDEMLLKVTRNRDTNTSLCTCSGVVVSNDLQVVKVYLTVLSENPDKKDEIMARMKGLSSCAARLPFGC